MRCDKCGKRFEDNWTPGYSYPRYKIIQECGVLSHHSSINLCEECSKKFKEWLEKETEEKYEELTNKDV